MTKILTLLAFLLPFAAGASPLTQLRAAVCPFRAKAAGKILSQAILEESSESEIIDLLNLEKKYGPCKKVTKISDDRFTFEFRDAAVDGDFHFDHKNHLEDFSYSEARFPEDSFTKLETLLKADGAGNGFWADRNGEKILAVNEEGALNISRAFHLFLVKTLEDTIHERDAKATDLVTLDGQARTVSFGLLHHWAPGTPITLGTLENLISVENDATAADLLIGALGKTRVEKQGSHIAPLFTYREMARLSESIQPGDAPATREAAFKRLAALSDADGIVDFPDERFDLVSTVGWFASAHELCTLVRALKNNPVLTHAYRDLRDQTRPDHGQEKVELLVDVRDSGVGQTTLLFQNGKDEFCLSYTLNSNGPLDERRMIDVVGRAENLLLKGTANRDDKGKSP
ncbi:MAG: serine hydrolase [Bdellovibrionota bacterium]